MAKVMSEIDEEAMLKLVGAAIYEKLRLNYPDLEHRWHGDIEAECARAAIDAIWTMPIDQGPTILDLYRATRPKP